MKNRMRIMTLLVALLMAFGAIACDGSASVASAQPTPEITASATEIPNGATKPEPNTRAMLDTSLPPFSGKARLIMVQDGEVDDKNSLIHLLLYANEIDIEGIVQTSSFLHYSGAESMPARRWMGTEWVQTYLDAYAAVYPNLIVHDPEYPEPEALRAVTKVGNVKAPSDMEEESPGSEWIRERILAEDERPLFIEIGGGANTVARALKSIEEAYCESDGWETMKQRISDHVILVAFGQQDSCYADYIRPNWPEMRFVDVSKGADAYGYKWGTAAGMTDEARELFTGSRMEASLLKDLGALMDLYITWGDGTYLDGEAENDQYGTNESLLDTAGWWGKYRHQRYDFLSEGDSPAWFLTIPNGLRGIEDLSYGSWAGCFEGKANSGGRFFESVNAIGMAVYADGIQKDFAMRASWCIAETYAEANHRPVLMVQEGTDLTAAPGQTVALHASATDPDRDTVSFLWYQDLYSDSYTEWINEWEEPIPIMVESRGESVSITIPSDAVDGETIHVILKGTDSGMGNLIAYQRVIITVRNP